MLLSDLCGQSLWLSSNLIWRKRTADMLEHICGSQGECLKMGLHISNQEFEISPLMIMGDHPSRDAPEPFNAVRIRIIGRRIDQIELPLQLGEHAEPLPSLASGSGSARVPPDLRCAPPVAQSAVLSDLAGPTRPCDSGFVSLPSRLPHNVDAAQPALLTLRGQRLSSVIPFLLFYAFLLSYHFPA